MESSIPQKNVDAQTTIQTEEEEDQQQAAESAINSKCSEGLIGTMDDEEGEIGRPSRSKESKRNRKTNVTEAETKLFFRLFKYLNDNEEYMLEAHQVTGGVSRYRINVYEQSNRWEIKVEEVAQRDHVVTAVLQDPTLLQFPQKYDILLEERLKGWTMEIRTRGNGKNKDTYYRHQCKQFRSLKETVAFILYSTDLKLLVKAN